MLSYCILGYNMFIFSFKNRKLIIYLHLLMYSESLSLSLSLSPSLPRLRNVLPARQKRSCHRANRPIINQLCSRNWPKNVNISTKTSPLILIICDLKTTTKNRNGSGRRLRNGNCDHRCNPPTGPL